MSRSALPTVVAAAVIAVVAAFSMLAPPLPAAAAPAARRPAAAPSALAAAPTSCLRTVTANVVALDQPIWLNRLGARMPGGMMFALARDVVDTSGGTCYPDPVSQCTPGQVMLDPAKRPRPIVLRADEGDCLQIVLTNLLNPAAGSYPQEISSAVPQAEAQAELRKPKKLLRSQPRQGTPAPPAAAQCDPSTTTCMSQPTTRSVGLHAMGMSWRNGPQDDGSFVGKNPDSLVAPGQSNKANPYVLFADHEGAYLLYSSADDWTNPTGGLGDGGTLTQGLFGAVNVEPTGARFVGYRRDLAVPEWYRSQVTEQDLCLASKDGVYDPATGLCARKDPSMLPVVDYQALYPDDSVHFPRRKNLPVLNMVCTAAAAGKGACQQGEIVHTDLTAIITGPGAGRFPASEPEQPALRAVYSLPNRLEPYREFTIIYHESFYVQQAFGAIYKDPNLPSLGSAEDNFGINYGMAAIGSEILANRLGVGPMKSCSECKYEEFFLSSWTVGDPAMNVDHPASTCVDSKGAKLVGCAPASVVRYPDDPSNVYHAYMADHVRFRVMHAGPDLHHLHHQHAHQWLHSPNTPNGDYSDSQSLGPGTAFSMEMVYNGSGNVNQTAGDSIFHCHFYPHFGSGMWSLWRVHDVLEPGTILGADGKPADRTNPFTHKKEFTRAQPDGEIVAGTPIPALVPLPTLPMAPLPAPVRLADQGKRVEVQLVERAGGDGDWVSTLRGGEPPPGKSFLNPGYPFFIAGIAGDRAPHPPLDTAYACSDNGARCSPVIGHLAADLSECQDPAHAVCEPLDGGLPRHVVAGGSAETPPINNTDFSKRLTKTHALELPEQGTQIEKLAMQIHGQRLHETCLPSGTCKGVCSDNGAPCGPEVGGTAECRDPGSATCVDEPVTFVLNGLGPAPGAPYADPCITFDREGGPAAESLPPRRYLAADVQFDALFNTSGWHFPQQRILTLWGDVRDTLAGKRAPEPLFFRANSNDCIEYTLANLVPNVYELDDFQVRTPTDILGQHIHLVKFDVTSSDGAGNGWNYEDGTFAPNEVTERIAAINAAGGLDRSELPGLSQPLRLQAKPIKFFGEGPGGSWLGAQASIQRWYADPLYNNSGFCSDNLADCTLIDLHNCADKDKAVCESSAGFCSNNGKRCTLDNFFNCLEPGKSKDDVECNTIHDRTLRTVFTHDHFGPSTHQQAGLYAGLVIEPRGSLWKRNESGTVFGGFDPATGDRVPSRTVTDNGATVRDGGPTTWQAVIETPIAKQSFREFLIEIQDSTLMYQPFAIPAFIADVRSPAGKQQFEGGDLGPCPASHEPCGFCSASGVCVSAAGRVASPPTRCAVPPPGPKPSGFPDSPCTGGAQCQLAVGHLIACTPEEPAGLAGCFSQGGIPSQVIQSCNYVTGVPATSWASKAIDVNAATPEIITFFGSTNSFSVNYRSEPLFPRTADPATGQALSGQRGDLAFAFSSLADRPNPRGQVCSSNLGQACSGTGSGGCTGGGQCQWAGFCSDNYALCTTDHKDLCGNRLTATCQGACQAPSSGACGQPFPYQPLTAGVQNGDPFTPLLRSYAGDDVKVRVLTGAHINPHNFTVEGLSWLMQPSFVDSGWRSSQTMGISEHFEFLAKMPPSFAGRASGSSTDMLYQAGAAGIEAAAGNWGLLRSYSSPQDTLAPLPQNPPGAAKALAACPRQAPVRAYDVVALTAFQALGGPLTYNASQKFDNSNAILFFDKRDLTCPQGKPLSSCKLGKGVAPEPLVLRAAAGDCVKVTLHNAIPASGFCSDNSAQACTFGSVAGCQDPQTAACVPYGFCSNDHSQACTPANAGTNCGPSEVCLPLIDLGTGTAQVLTPAGCAVADYPPQPSNCGAEKSNNPPCCQPSYTSQYVGLRPQLVSFDSQTSGGTNAGLDQVQTVAPGGQTTYAWYAGHLDAAQADPYIPIEFGAANLLPPDVLNHYGFDLFGGLIIEPKGATWSPVPGAPRSRTRALVRFTDQAGKASSFREFVVFIQDALFQRGGAIDAVNFGNELLTPGTRLCASCDANDNSCILAAESFSGSPGSCTAAPFVPATPTFQACAGEEVRFRLLHPGGINTNNAIEIYGHNWSESPYMTRPEHCEAPTTQTNLFASQIIGNQNLCGAGAFKLTPDHSGFWDASLNSWQGAHNGHGPSNHFDILIASAGGPFAVPGDYLYRSYPADHFNLGDWGIFRVVKPSDPACRAPQAAKQAARPRSAGGGGQ